MKLVYFVGFAVAVILIYSLIPLQSGAWDTPTRTTTTLGFVVDYQNAQTMEELVSRESSIFMDGLPFAVLSRIDTLDDELALAYDRVPEKKKPAFAALIGLSRDVREVVTAQRSLDNVPLECPYMDVISSNWVTAYTAVSRAKLRVTELSGLRDEYRDIPHITTSWNMTLTNMQDDLGKTAFEFREKCKTPLVR